MITFHINYRTNWGEELVLVSGGKMFHMTSGDDGDWTIVVKTPKKGQLVYSYIVSRDGKVLRSEWRSHVIDVPSRSARDIDIYDYWKERPALSPFCSSAFTGAIFSHDGDALGQLQPEPECDLLVYCDAPLVKKGEYLALTGNCEALGNWDPRRSVPMTGNGLTWRVNLRSSELPAVVAYKFIIVDGNRDIVEWEAGDNRLLRSADGLRMVCHAYRPTGTRQWRGAGVAIPVFSLRSQRSFGIGEFADIPLLVDWAVKTGMSVVQLLPINDTTMTRTWTDSYPYNAISSFALHPAYINIEAVGRLTNKADQRRYALLKEELGALPQVDYERTTEAKWAFLRKLYHDKGTQVLTSPAFRRFYRQNMEWLRPYAVFCYLRDRYATPDFNQWQEKYSEKLVDSLAPDPAFLPTTYNAAQREVAFHYYIQYHLHVQLTQAVDYARSKGIVLKGDIPIGISRTSVDAWTHPTLFHMNGQAGAPPDVFAQDGQNWGFPTYNWEAMAAENYAWFRNRFAKMSDYFDAYRIDHLLGFFRIWEIPSQYRSGLLGHFNPSLPYRQEEIEARMGMAMRDISIDDGSQNTEVLFVHDPYRSGFYHPRIEGYRTTAFQNLSEAAKQAYRDIHEEYFFRRHEAFWRSEAMKKLPALTDCTDMLVCGEDLGMIPSCVPSVMKELNILSLEIERMPKAMGVDFADTRSYPYYSVCTTGTHDTSCLRAWWEEDPALAQRYWNGVLHHAGTAPAHLEPFVCEEILRNHMQSPSMLAIIPLQDWLSIDGALRAADPMAERINVPANPRHYWRYRMHLTLEELNAADDFNANLRKLTQR